MASNFFLLPPFFYFRTAFKWITLRTLSFIFFSNLFYFSPNFFSFSQTLSSSSQTPSFLSSPSTPFSPQKACTLAPDDSVFFSLPTWRTSRDTFAWFPKQPIFLFSPHLVHPSLSRCPSCHLKKALLFLYSSMHSFIHPFIHLSTNSSIHPFTHSSIHPSIHPRTHPLTHPYSASSASSLNKKRSFCTLSPPSLNLGGQ